MVQFKNSLAFRIFNFAIKVEKLAKDSAKMRDIKELEALAKLQGVLESNIELLFEQTLETEKIIKQLKQKEL